MKTIEELTRTEGYWLTTIQSDLYAKVEEFRKARGWTRSQLAEHLGVSKGYVSQVLNGDFDHKLSSLIRLALAVDTVPNLKFQDPTEYVENYVSGYDGCLNAKYVTATITVGHEPPRLVVSGGGRLETTTPLIDRESTITFQVTSSQSVNYAEVA